MTVRRNLTVRFLESGDVAYNFYQHHSKFMLDRYLIQWPADKVELSGGQFLKDHGFRATTTPEGFLLLEWNKVLESDVNSGRGVDYVKRGYLEKISDDPAYWRYCEDFKIEPDFALGLHTPYDVINAVKAQSDAMFVGTDGYQRRYQPRELSDWMFRFEGVLKVDWTLAVLEKPRYRW